MSPVKVNETVTDLLYCTYCTVEYSFKISLKIIYHETLSHSLLVSDPGVAVSLI